MACRGVHGGRGRFTASRKVQGGRGGSTEARTATVRCTAEAGDTRRLVRLKGWCMAPRGAHGGRGSFTASRDVQDGRGKTHSYSRAPRRLERSTAEGGGQRCLESST